MSTMTVVRGRAALVTAAVIAVAGAPTGGAVAVTVPPATIEVALGAHVFGALSPAEAVVARMGPDGVGWVQQPEGVSYGPGSFEVAVDRTVWLLDEVNDRLLRWAPGRPGGPATAVPLPASSVDFAVRPGGGFYVTTHPPGSTMTLNAVAADGVVRWQAPLAEDLFNAQLRIGPNGILYQVTPTAWIPVADATGSALTVERQRQGALPYQPLTGGRRLTVTSLSDREIRVVLGDSTGRPVRTWRITGRTDMGLMNVSPAAIGPDVVLTLDVFRSTPSFRREQLALRLTGSGAPVRLHLDNAFWGDVPVTEYRVGPDGAFYQLRTSRTAGVTIVRYALTPIAPTPSASGGGGGALPPVTPSASPVPPTAPAGAPSPSVTPGVAAGENGSSGIWLVWAGGAGLAVVAALGIGYAVWLRRRTKRLDR